jgi:hypothetical protein
MGIMWKRLNLWSREALTVRSFLLEVMKSQALFYVFFPQIIMVLIIKIMTATSTSEQGALGIIPK